MEQDLVEKNENEINKQPKDKDNEFIIETISELKEVRVKSTTNK